MKRTILSTIGAVVAALLMLVVAIVVILVPADTPPDPPAALCAPDGGPVAQVGVVPGGPSVATLTAEQSQNARVIVAAGQAAGVPQRGFVVAIATALQESGLKNINYGDRDSLGLFQQRAPWGSAAERTNPAVSATMFYRGGKGGQRGLLGVPGWQQMPVWKAAQTVQVSAFPTAYAKWEGLATSTVTAILASGGGGAAAPAVAPQPCPDAQQAGYAGPTGTWTQPEASGTYVRTSKFGMRVNPVSGVYKLHGGTDLAGTKQRCGQPTRAAAAGKATVQGINQSGGFGNLVIVDHGGGIQTYYAHHSRVTVTSGQTVAPGQQLGFEGSTGNSTGCHLHFEVHVNGKRVDPEVFMRERGAPL